MGISDRVAKLIWGRPGQYSGAFHNDEMPDAGPHSGGALEQFFLENTGPVVHKWHHYFPIYEKWFGPFRGKPIRMLEIGVAKGGSLDVWRSYFGPEAVLFGIDIDPSCAQFDGKSGQVRIGSQDDPAFLASVIDEMGGVDIVLDDGSHDSRHIRASLDALYPRLSNGGIYMIEDLHAAYWPRLSGGYRRPISFMTVVKTIIDDMHHWYHHKGQKISSVAGKVGGLHIYDSIVVLEKIDVVRPTNSGRGRA